MHNSDFIIYDNKDISKIQQQAKDLLCNHSVQGYKIFLDQLFELLNVEIIKTPKYDNRICKLLSLINECDCDCHTLSYFANELALSESRLSHLFKEQVGISLKSFITFHQLKRAFTELLNGKSITESALIAGFDSPSHFASTTKRILGMSASLSLRGSELLNVFSCETLWEMYPL